MQTNFSFRVQKLVRTKFGTSKLISLKSLFVNTDILIATEIVFACFNKVGYGDDNKNKRKINILL